VVKTQNQRRIYRDATAVNNSFIHDGDEVSIGTQRDKISRVEQVQSLTGCYVSNKLLYLEKVVRGGGSIIRQRDMKCDTLVGAQH